MENKVISMMGRDLFGLLLVLVLSASPLLAFAQVDDIYFVPTKKSEKPLVVESVVKKYDVVDVVEDTLFDVDKYNRRVGGFTNDPEAYIDDIIENGDSIDEYDDYDYSTRIIRFRNPSRALSTIYWDLAFDSGIYDWYVYDTGYAIDIYPTASNPLYYWDTSYYLWNSMNYYNWRSWYNWYAWNYNSYWDWYYPGYKHHYYHCGYHWHHNNHWNDYAYSYNYKKFRGHIPTNGSVSTSSRRGNRDNASVNINKKDKKDRITNRDVAGKKKKDGTVANNTRKTTGRDGNRTVSSLRKDRKNKDGKETANLKGKDSGPRRQQPARTVVNSKKRKDGSLNKDNANVRKNNNNGGVAKRKDGTVNRRSSTTGSYNRKSSTNSTRSRSTSVSTRSNSSTTPSYNRSSSRSTGGSYSSGSRSTGGGSRSSGGGTRGGRR